MEKKTMLFALIGTEAPFCKLASSVLPAHGIIFSKESSRTLSTLRSFFKFFLALCEKIAPLFLCVNIVCVSTVFATDYKAFAEEIQQKQPSSEDVEFAKKMADQQSLNLKDVYKTAKDLEFLVGKLPAKGEGCKGCGASILIQPQDIVDMDNCRPSGGTPVNESSVTLVFVSFSMPKASLVELSDQAQKYNATLVLRGIHGESFLKTKDKILEISPNGLQLDINPELFKRYKIQKVPTFVLVKDGKEINRLAGNVTLEFAQSKLMESEQ